MEQAKLERYGLIAVSGDDARDFLHAQLTNDIKNLAPGQAALAGWCSAKGRLLASFLVIPTPEGFLLQLSRDLVPGVLKRLSMFVLRSKVKIADVTDTWAQYGVWGRSQDVRLPAEQFALIRNGHSIWVRIDNNRYLVVS